MAPLAPRFLAARTCVLAAALLSLHAACSRQSTESQPAPEVPVLELGKELELELEPGQTRSFRIEAQAGELIYIVVDQRGIDVIAALLGPGDKVLVRSDRAIDDIGPEPLLALAEAEGSYQLRVEVPPGDGPPGKCVVWLDELHSASDADRRRAEAARNFFKARQDRGRPAIELYRLALDAWRELDDPLWVAECAQRLGREYFRLGEWEEAATLHEQAADLYQEAGDTRLEAIARTHLGRTYQSLWDIERAIQSYQQVLPLRQAAGDRRGEALTMLNLAQVYQYQDEVQKALDYYTRGLELFPSRDRNLRAIAIHDLGVLHLALGQMEEARKKLETADEVWAELESPRRTASLLKLGELHLKLGEFDAALDYSRSALTLHRQANDRRGEAIALSNIARVRQARGELDLALGLSLEAWEILRKLRFPRAEANLLRNLGSLYVDQGQSAEAKRYFRQAFDLYRQVGDPTGEAESLLGVAIAERQRGELTAALEASQEALEIFESVRPKAVRHEHRASFFATVQEHFESHIDLLMALHESDGEARYDARALLASERARTRSLLDLLAEAEAGIRAGAAPDLMEREGNLQRRLNTREYRLLKLRNSPKTDPDDLETAQEAVAQTLDELQELWGEIRRRDPHYTALTESPIPSLVETQHQILDEDTLLLEYQLGQDRSFLWAVTHDSLTSHALPGRQEIERLARKATELLEVSHRPQARTSSRIALCSLAKQILHPVVSRLADKRLLIVSDGALLYVPFAALPEAGRADECLSAPPLVVNHEIIHLPSISVLSILRRDYKDRPPAPFQVAVVADPVFDTSDERFIASALANTKGTFSLEEPATPARSAGSQFSRLPYSEREALAILTLVPEQQRFTAMGFEASKETVTSGRLAKYRIVHFATHGILDTEQPSFSKIVLSQIDREGRRRDGFLRTHEIYNLRLPSDLVVLSACQTALGKAIRGEGLVGLTRGFMYAGAARVMVSLWNVDDKSTAVLMERFYRGLFERGLRPATALHQAQISMWRETEWTAPFHWAGFVIQGDWR